MVYSHVGRDRGDLLEVIQNPEHNVLPIRGRTRASLDVHTLIRTLFDLHNSSKKAVAASFPFYSQRN